MTAEDYTSNKPVVLIRDGTIFGPDGTEIDFRTPDYGVWLTIKGKSDAVVEAVATALESKFGTEGATTRQGTGAAESAGSGGSGASPHSEVGAE